MIRLVDHFQDLRNEGGKLRRFTVGDMSFQCVMRTGHRHPKGRAFLLLRAPVRGMEAPLAAYPGGRPHFWSAASPAVRGHQIRCTRLGDRPLSLVPLLLIDVPTWARL